MNPEERQIMIPVAVRVGTREIEVPITVSVGLDDLVQIVVEHLNTGADMRELLVAHYARTAYGAEAEAGEPTGLDGRSRPPEPPVFSDEELDRVDLEGEPPSYSGRGKKSRRRLLWEAAMERAGRSF